MTKQPSEPDYDFWMGMASWSKDEAMALAVGMDPDVADWRSHVSDDQNKRVRQIERGILTGVFPNSDVINPHDFLSEMTSNDFNYPNGLVTAANAQKIDVKNWRLENEKLVAELEVLRKRISEGDKPKRPEPSLETLYKIILGVAYGRHGYRPGERRNVATQAIVNEASRADIEISPETVLNTLRKAADALDFEPPRD